MASSATITAKVGPGNTVTALALSNVTEIKLNCESKVLTISQGSTVNEFDVNASSTYTLTVSSGNFSLTVT